MASDPLYYGDYLQLGKILDAQHLESSKKGTAAHDEMLFIIVHQTYELWFKQIIWEVDAAIRILNKEVVQEKALGKAVAHLERVVSIQRVLMEQIDVLETMTPLDFLDFRDDLFPASGFQSAQWRLIENKMGMRPQDRHASTKTAYTSRFSDEDKMTVEASEKSASLFSLIESWLARTPFIEFGDFDFWDAYCGAVSRMLASDKALIEGHPTLSGSEKEGQLENLRSTEIHFEALFDDKQYQNLIETGEKRLSHRALKAALLIHLYRDEPILHLPFRLLHVLGDVDENFTNWRYRHSLMARRMIGTKIGTGGSSGHEYLRKAAQHNKVFSDLVNLSTFFIPRSELPTLPEEVIEQLGFHWNPG